MEVHPIVFTVTNDPYHLAEAIVLHFKPPFNFPVCTLPNEVEATSTIQIVRMRQLEPQQRSGSLGFLIDLPISNSRSRWSSA